MPSEWNLWAVKNADGDIIASTVSGLRKDAIDSWLSVWSKRSLTRWSNWYRRGFRCVRVTIIETGGPDA